MNCNDCKNNMHVLIDEHADANLTAAMKQHIASCASCAAAYQQMQAVITALQPAVSANAPLSLKQNIINQLQKKDINMKQVKSERAFLSPVAKRILSAAAVVAALILIIPFFNSKKDTSGNSARAASLFGFAIDATAQVKSMVINCSIRTSAKDNFDLIGKEYGMVEHTITKTFDAPQKWRVEKPGRTVLFDGNNQYLWIPQLQEAVKGTANAGFVEWLKILLDPASILWKEKEDAKENGSGITMKEADGKSLVTITSKAKGNFMNDYMKNKTLEGADNRREYVFDSKTTLLKGLKIYLLENKTETLVLDIENIQYDVTVDPAVFSITLPAGIAWREINTTVVNENFSNITSRHAAELIFAALAKNDLETDKEVWEQYNFISKKMIASNYGGLQVISIGESFKSGNYPGEFVPYEIKLPGGSVKKYKLALRNDNKNKVWMVDGGL